MDPEILDAFYRRVRPLALWRRTVERIGHEPGRPGRLFLQCAYLVATTASTLYLLLVGAMKLFLPQTGEPDWVAWLLAAAAATVPLWWHRFRKPERREV